MLRQLGELITKKPLAIVALWAIILIVSIPLATSLDGRLHYDITSFIPKNLESYAEKTTYDALYPGVYKSQIIVAVESNNKTEAMRFVDMLNGTVAADGRIGNVTETASIYDIQRQALVSMTPSLHATMYDLLDNASSANARLYDAKDEVRNTSGQLYGLKYAFLGAYAQLQSSYNTIESSNGQLYSAREQVASANSGLWRIHGAADLVYSVPAAYAQAFASAARNGSDVTTARTVAVAAVKARVIGSVPTEYKALETGYLNAYDAAWAAAVTADPSRLNDTTLAQTLINTVAPAVFSTANVGESAATFQATVAFGIDRWANPDQLKSCIVGLAMASEGLTSAGDRARLASIYDLGESPSSSAIDACVLAAATQGMSADQARAVEEVYALGKSPSHAAIAEYLLDKACEGKNATESQIIRDAWSMGDVTSDVADGYALDKACEGKNATQCKAIRDIYALGQNPNDTAIDAYVLGEVTGDLNDTAADFVRGAYALGRNATDAELRAYVCTKVAENLNVTGNLSYFTAVMAIDRNATDTELDEFAHDWAYSHDYTDPDLFPEGTAENLASGDLTLYAVMLSDEEATAEAHEDVQYIRDDVASLTDTGLFPGIKAYVTGMSAFGMDTADSAEGDVSSIDRISVALILVILGAYFLSILTPFIPLAAIGAAIVTGFGALYLASFNVDLYYLTKTFMIVVMLGAGTDYCVFILSRYAEERGRGADVKESVVHAVEHAGKSVLCSGTTAMVGFASLMLIDNGIFNSMGQSMAIAILVSMLVAMTLMPAVLALAGDRLFWPRKIYNTGARASRTGKAMRRITHEVLGHWKLVLAATVLLAIPAVYLCLQMDLGQDFISMLPGTIESKVGYDAINAEFGSGNIEKTRVLVTLPLALRDGDSYSSAALGQVEEISALAASIDGVDAVYSMSRPNGEPIDYANLPSYSTMERAYYEERMNDSIGADGRTTTIEVAFVGSPYSEEADRAIDAIRESMDGYAEAHPGTTIAVGGNAAMSYDYQNFASSRFAPVIAVVFVGIFLVLLYLLKSIWTPVRLFVSMFMGIVWTLAAFTAVFQYWLHVPIIWILPIVLFCTLMGLGGDYVVFMMSRVKEEVTRGSSDEEAIERAVEATGPVILLCGLVMAAAFGSMMISDMAELREFGFVLSVAILLDSTLMVLVLIPSILMFLRKYNWWMPFGKAHETTPPGER